jgi:hypothetical protein
MLIKLRCSGCGASPSRTAADYCLERLRPPTADEVLGELIEVTAAINDAPMGRTDL